MARIAPDSHVTLHYRMAVLVDGAERELVNTFETAPATLQMGVGQWAQTLEERLLGLDEGQQLDITLPAEQAYGPHLPELVRIIARAQLREPGGVAGSPIAVGATVETTPINGAAPLRGMLTGGDQERGWVDFNHPLAGRQLRLCVQVIGVL